MFFRRRASVGLSLLRSAGHVLSLRAFLPLADLELHIIAFLQALVAIRLDSAVVDKDIGAIILADESEAFGVIEPFHLTFYSRHLASLRTELGGGRSSYHIQDPGFCQASLMTCSRAGQSV